MALIALTRYKISCCLLETLAPSSQIHSPLRLLSLSPPRGSRRSSPWEAPPPLSVERRAGGCPRLSPGSVLRDRYGAARLCPPGERSCRSSSSRRPVLRWPRPSGARRPPWLAATRSTATSARCARHCSRPPPPPCLPRCFHCATGYASLRPPAGLMAEPAFGRHFYPLPPHTAVQVFASVFSSHLFLYLPFVFWFFPQIDLDPDLYWPCVWLLHRTGWTVVWPVLVSLCILGCVILLWWLFSVSLRVFLFRFRLKL